MPTMNISLTQEMADYVSEELQRGDHASASEVVRDALRLLRRDRDLEAQKLEILRHKLSIGLAQADRREFISETVSDIANSVLAEDDEE